MRIIFWMLFGLGSALLVFAVLLGQVPGEATGFQKAVLSVTAIVLSASLVMGRFSRADGKRPAGQTPTVILILELILCLWGLVDALTYKRGH
jgi:hypothetical protein